MKAAKWIMRAITTAVFCVIMAVIIISAVLGRQDRLTMKEEKKNRAKSSYVAKLLDMEKTFSSLHVQAASDMDITLKQSEDGQCHVEYYDSDDVTHFVYIQDDTLTISCLDERIFETDFGFGEDPVITVSLPDLQYDDFTIISQSGNITVNAPLYFSKLDIEVDDGNVFVSGAGGDRVSIVTGSGDVTVATMKAKRLSIKGDSGDFFLMNVETDNMDIASGDGLLEGYNLSSWASQTFKTDKGDIAIEGCQGGTMWLSSRKGNIDISLLSPKRIMVDSDNGEISVEKSAPGVYESCMARTASGNIIIKYITEQEE